MTDSRAELRSRFRGTLATRVQTISECLVAATSSSPGAQPRVEVLGELHTLKGEARMLGWTHLSTLAHEVEECLRASEPDTDALAAVLDSILLSLSPTTDQGTAEGMWRMALLALGVSVEEEENPSEETESNPELKAKPGTPQSASWMQVSTKTVDDLGESLANLSGEFAKFATRQASTDKVSATTYQETQAEFDRLRALLTEALLLSLDLRLTPVEPLLRRIAAHARVLGTERGKSLRVQVHSQNARIERSLIDRLGELLLHLVNNAVDHGLEESGRRTGKDQIATLEVSAEPEGAFVALRVKDDGKGIDEQAVLKRARARGLTEPTGHVLDLLFEPGFSTKESIDEVSGRGVGLDVVKRGVESLGGSISLSTELGQGTTFTLLIPAALTQERLIVVRSGSTLYGISGHLVLSVEQEQESQNFKYKDEFLPRRSLSSILGAPAETKASAVCVIRIDGNCYALGCEEILGHFELIRRPTGPRLANFSGVSGSAQTDEGELVLLLDPRALRRSLTRESIAHSHKEKEGVVERPRILVVDDSVVVRDLLSEVLSAAGYQIRSARNGREALAEMESFAPALVLSDLEMPEMDGFRLLEVIRSRSERLPVILVTARSSQADRTRAEALGATAYVTKGDFQSESLVNVVKRLLSEDK